MPRRATSWRLAQPSLLLVGCALLLASCDRTSPPPRPSGFLNLEHVESIGSTLVFNLENHSNQPLYFRGTSDATGAEPLLQYTRLSCRTLYSGEWRSEDGKISEAGPE